MGWKMADGWMLHNDGFWHQLHGIYCRIGEEWDFGGELQSFFWGLKMSLLVKKKTKQQNTAKDWRSEAAFTTATKGSQWKIRCR